MRIIAIEKELNGKAIEDYKSLLESEARRVWELYKSELIRDIYFRADQKSAILILECKDIQDAEKNLATLPLVKNKFISFELIPLAPYTGFERLFK